MGEVGEVRRMRWVQRRSYGKGFTRCGLLEDRIL